MGSLYQTSNPNLPNYESGYSVRDIDRDVVSSMNGVNYYDYDVKEKQTIYGTGGDKILAPTELDTGLPMMRTDIDPDDPITISGPDFLLGDGGASMGERIDVVNNGRLGNINVVQTSLPEGGDIVINKDNQETSIKGIVEKTALSDIFFSDMNMDVIHKSIRYGVNQNTGKIIAKQDNNTIYIIMRSILLQYANFRVSVADLAEETRSLNQRVIDYCVSNISSNVQQYIGYISDLEKLPTPMDHPVYHNKNNFTYDISNLL